MGKEKKDKLCYNAFMSEEKLSYLSYLILKTSFYFLFFFTPLIFSPFNNELFEFPKMHFVYFLTLICLAVWLVNTFTKREIKLVKTPLDIPIILYLLSAFISTFKSLEPYTSLWGYYSRSHGGLMSLISYTLLYYLFINFLNDYHLSFFPKNKKNKLLLSYLNVFLFSTFISSLYGILEKAGIDKNIWIQDVQNRVFSTLGQPNWLGAFVTSLILIPLAFYLKNNNKIYLFIYYIYLLCLFFTNSKSAILAFWISFLLFCSILFIFYYNRKKRLVIILLFISSLFLYLFFGRKTLFYFKKTSLWFKNFFYQSPSQIAVKNQNKNYFIGITDSSEIRKIVWLGALKIFRNNPFFGTGLETFAYAYYQHRPVEHNYTSEWDYLYNKAHNEFLNILACQGIVGLLSYSFFILSFIYWNFKYIFPKLKKKKEKEILIFSFFLGFISLLITNFFGFSVVITGLLFYFLPAFSLLFSAQQLPYFLKYRINFIKNNNIKIFAFFIVFIFFFAAETKIIKRFKADIFYNYGEKAYQSNNFLKAFFYLQKALSLNPNEALYHSLIAKTSAKLALLYTSEKNQENVKSKQLTKDFIKLAEAEINQALFLNSVNVNFYKNKAEVYLYLSHFDSKKKEEVIKALLKAQTLAPTDAKIPYNLGLLYLEQNDLEKAKFFLQKSLDLKPDYQIAKEALKKIENKNN